MNHFKRLLAAPISNTLIVFLCALIACIVFIELSMYLSNILISIHMSKHCQEVGCRNLALEFPISVLFDLSTLMRYVTELSGLTLIAQLIWRAIQRFQK